LPQSIQLQTLQDVYSYGIVMFETFALGWAFSMPFEGLDNNGVVRALANRESPIHTSLPMPFDDSHPFAATLIACVTRDPVARPTFTDLAALCLPFAVGDSDVGANSGTSIQGAVVNKADGYGGAGLPRHLHLQPQPAIGANHSVLVQNRHDVGEVGHSFRERAESSA
jgi:hypothetical protein